MARMTAQRRETQIWNAQLRRARLEHARYEGTHTDVEWAQLQREFGHRCVRCWRPWYECRPLTRDHIVPVARDGSDAISNIQPMCCWCNSSKGTRIEDWATFRRNFGFAEEARRGG